MKRLMSGRRSAILGMFLLAALLAGRGALAAVTVIPSQTSVTPGQANVLTIQYQFTGLLGGGALPGPYSGPEESLSPGSFLGPTRNSLGTAGATVIASVTGGSGVATETITVPPSVIETALRLGFRQITFERTWIGASNSPTTQVSILIASSEAVGPLRIRRIELYFENRRGEITVDRNRRGLKAFADIRFAGSGLLSGYWEVDGRRILDVNRNLYFGTSVTLSTPDVPDLPTFDTGAHIVRFVINTPSAAFTLPQLLYYVTAAKELRKILITPRDGEAGGAATKREFAWEKPDGIGLFFLEFSEAPGGKPVFSAFTRENRYSLPVTGAERYFTKGKKYFWRVKGYDASDDLVGESEPAPFVY